MKCPTCASPVRVAGNTTKYYVSENEDLKESLAKASEKNEALKDKLYHSTRDVENKWYIENAKLKESLIEATAILKNSIGKIEDELRLDEELHLAWGDFKKISNQLHQFLEQLKSKHKFLGE